MRQPYRAFVSSTYLDLKAHRSYVIKALRESGISVDPMEDWQADNDEPKVFSTARMQGCDVCVLLVAHRRGFVPDGESESITQLEYRYAVSNRIPVLPFILDANAPWWSQFDERKLDPAVDEWRTHVSASHGAALFGLDATSIPILQSIARWIAESREERLAAVLQPLPKESATPTASDDFVGRSWIFNRIDKWLNDPTMSRVFWIIGPPGVGKTAITMQLCGRFDQVKALHVCRYGDSARADPARCVKSIAYQLSTALPEYDRRLRKLPLESFVEQSNAETLFDRLIVQPFWQGFPAPERPVVIAIDALDEVTRAGRNELADFLAFQFAKTPAWLRLIITSRAEPEVLTPLAAFDPVPLEASSSENISDLREYLTSKLPRIAAASGAASDVIETLLERSEGSFLYLHWVCEELTAGRLSAARPREFPLGLAGIYHSFFNRRFDDLPEYRARIRPALQVIAAAREPLAISILCQCLNWSEQDQADFRLAVGTLFSERNGCIEPFHRSVTDWMTDQARAGRYFVSERDGHRVMAAFGWKALQRAVPPAYVDRHLPEHLAQSKEWSQLRQVLGSPRHVSRAWKSGNVYEWMHYWQLLEGGQGAGEAFGVAFDELEPTVNNKGDLATLADRVAWLLGEMGLHSDARRIAERGLSWRKQQLGDQHLDVAASLYILAETCRRESDYESARPLYEQALTIRRTAGNAEAAVAETLHGLGEFYHDQRRDTEAERAYLECLEVSKRCLPPNDPTIATCMNDLGALLIENERDDDALPYCREAERIYRVAFGPGHPEFASARFNQARIYQRNGNYVRAWPLFLDALEVHERVYPAGHAKIQTCKRAFANIFELLDEPTKAVASEQLIAARERAYGIEHDLTMQTIEMFAWRFITSNPEAAVSRAERVVERRKMFNGPDHPATAAALNLLVRCLQMAGRFADALPFAKRALVIREALSDVSSADLAVSLNNLALLYIELDRELDLAERLLHQCRKVDPTAPNANYWLGRLYERLGPPAQTSELEAWNAYLTLKPSDENRVEYAKRRLAALNSMGTATAM